jgi:3-keto-L-gulonate-6-phosphate decarboxylase
VEAGTPLIKRYGENGIRKIRQWYEAHLWGMPVAPQAEITIGGVLGMLIKQAQKKQSRMKQAAVTKPESGIEPYIVADLKTADRGETEVEMAARAGADGAVALGHAPVESLNAFIAKCSELGLDAMIDMMNVEYPLAVLRGLKKLPRVVILHRGVDEERFNKEKQIPLHEIRRIKGGCDILLSIAGGDTIREVQRAIFNDADIVVVWKEFYQSSADTANLAEQFLAEVK